LPSQMLLCQDLIQPQAALQKKLTFIQVQHVYA
jgi:hypothetical protein